MNEKSLFSKIQAWAWRRDNRRFPKKSTVSEAAKFFNATVEEIHRVVGTDYPYFYIVGEGDAAYFEHDGE